MAEHFDSLRTVQHGNVGEIVLNRPHVRNALGQPERRELFAALRSTVDSGSRAIVLTGAGSIFCAGGDIRAMRPEGSAERLAEISALVKLLSDIPVAVVVAVEGGAFGLGLALTALGDVVVAGESARFSASFARLGLTADSGLSWSLPRRIGSARTTRMLVTAEIIDASTATEWGLVDHRAPDGSARDRALTLATEISEMSPPSIAATRRLMARPPADLGSALDAEAREQTELLATPDFTAARDAFLASRRQST